MAMPALRLTFAAGCVFLRIAAAAAQNADDGTPPKPAPWDQAMFDEGKLLATGGVSAVEGEGGGGLAGWALITSYGTRDGIGVNVHDTYVGLPDYQLLSPGIAVGLFDRLELSYAWQAFDTEATGAALGLGQGYTFHQNIWRCYT